MIVRLVPISWESPISVLINDFKNAELITSYLFCLSMTEAISIVWTHLALVLFFLFYFITCSEKLLFYFFNRNKEVFQLSFKNSFISLFLPILNFFLFFYVSVLLNFVIFFFKTYLLSFIHSFVSAPLKGELIVSYFVILIFIYSISFITIITK